MRYIILIFISVFCLQSSHAQIHEIGVYMGGSNFIGDVGATNYIYPTKLAYGGIYKWNRSPRHSWRFSGTITDLLFFDKDASDPRRVERDYNGTKTVGELSAGIEFTFFDFDLHKSGRQHTPYLYSGITATNYNETYFNSSGNSVVTGDKKWALGIPMTIGYKYRFSGSFIIAAEIGARYTFTDNLEGSDYFDDSTATDYSFGNVNNNDWYMFSGITLTYTFGRNPCYCIN